MTRRGPHVHGDIGDGRRSAPRTRRARPPWWQSAPLLALLASGALALPPAAIADDGSGIRAAQPLDLIPASHPWRASLLWAVDAMDSVAGGTRRGWGVPAVLDLRLEQHGVLADGLDSHWRVDVIRTTGTNPSEQAGDVQGLDNIAAPHVWRVYHAFWQLNDRSRHWALRAGWQGYDEAFALVPAGSDLINSSFGEAPSFSQAGVPIWPETALGATALWAPGPLFVQAGLWSGTPRNPGTHQGWGLPRGGDGALQALEFGVQRHGDYKLAVGGWSLHRASARDAAHRGGYALAQLHLLDTGANGHVSGFAQWSGTRPYRSDIARYVGAGLRWTPAAQARGRLSVGVARATLGAAFRARHPAAAATETAFEVTWRQRIGARLSVQPDLQYIVHPALAPTRDHALVIGVRVDGRF